MINLVEILNTYMHTYIPITSLNTLPWIRNLIIFPVHNDTSTHECKPPDSPLTHPFTSIHAGALPNPRFIKSSLKTLAHWIKNNNLKKKEWRIQTPNFHTVTIFHGKTPADTYAFTSQEFNRVYSRTHFSPIFVQFFIKRDTIHTQSKNKQKKKKSKKSRVFSSRTIHSPNNWNFPKILFLFFNKQSID